MNKTDLKRVLSPFYKLRYHLKSTGWIYVGAHSKIINPRHIKLGDGDQIAPYCLICPHGTASIILGDNVSIGMFSRIACINEVFIGDNTLTGPNVFISDYNHAYENVDLPISKQGNTPRVNRVVIEEDCWIGTNTVICGSVHIGKHSVIGAGSFVNKDIPGYCVAVGNPAKIVKRYNFETKMWERVDAEALM